MRKALLLVDIQNDYFPGGAMELIGSREAGLLAGRLLEVFRSRGYPVVHIQHISLRKGASFFLPDSDGVKINSSVSPAEGEIVITKNFPNSFRETELLEYLRSENISKLVIAGMMTHMCIDTTTRAAADLGFECTLAHDACATKDLEFGNITISAKNVHASFLAALHGIFARVASTDEICREIE